VNADLGALIRTLSTSQLSDALIAIAQQVAQD
jgi:hypothetical protein